MKSFKKGVTLKFNLYKKGHDKLLTTGTITFISINEKRKPISLPQHVLDRLREYEDEISL